MKTKKIRLVDFLTLLDLEFYENFKDQNEFTKYRIRFSTENEEIIGSIYDPRLKPYLKCILAEIYIEDTYTILVDLSR